MIVLSPQMVKELQHHRRLDLEECLATGRKPHVIFHKGNGEHINYMTIRSNWLKMLEATGLGRYKIHHIRHSVCCLLIDAGTPIADVQSLLGYSYPAMTLGVYTHAIAKEKSIASPLDMPEPEDLAVSSRRMDYKVLKSLRMKDQVNRTGYSVKG